HYTDIGRLDLADTEFALARALFPNHRGSYVRGTLPFVRRGERLFESNEVGHPKMLVRDIAALTTDITEHGSIACEGVEYILMPARPRTQMGRPAPATVTIPQCVPLDSKG